MKRFLLACLVALCILLSGCSPALERGAVNTASNVANTMASSITGLQGAAQALYFSEQVDVIVKGDAVLGSGLTKTQVMVELTKVRNRWKPVWLAFDELRGTHTALVTIIVRANDALTRGDHPSLDDLNDLVVLEDKLKSLFSALEDLVRALRIPGGSLPMDPRLLAVLSFVGLLVKELPEVIPVIRSIVQKWGAQEGIPLTALLDDQHEAVDAQIDAIVNRNFPELCRNPAPSPLLARSPPLLTDSGPGWTACVRSPRT
jgi:hypothetical protein